MTLIDVRKHNSDLLKSYTKQLLGWAKEKFGDKIFITSAFGINGIVLLDIIKEEMPSIPVYFINTGFHFKETLEVKEHYKKAGYNIIEISADVAQENLREKYGHDLCCQVNKVEPMKKMLQDKKGLLWITALSRDQSTNRGKVPILQLLSNGTYKFNPLIAWTTDDVWYYVKSHKLYYNKLYDKGFKSIGCQPCTTPSLSGEQDRSGRWRGSSKTECGLHTEI